MGTSNDVLMFAASGTGAMDASVSNLFSRGDKVIVCSAGKFGERWAEIAKAYGLDADVLTVPYGEVVERRAGGGRAGGRAGDAGRVRAGIGNLHRRGARRAGHGPGRRARPTPSSWWTPSPASAPCRSISTAGASTW